MQAFELQTYKNGKWDVDSYFDDRQLALSEAQRLEGSARHMGVRVVQEEYDEQSNKADCHVIFSRMKNIGEQDEWRGQAMRASREPQGSTPRREGANQVRQRRPKPKKSKGNLYVTIAIGLVLLLAGVAAMIGLQEIASLL